MQLKNAACAVRYCAVHALATAAGERFMMNRK
jgi:hypothetical protein